jgi:5-methylcytosine-specific restriction protein A
VTYIAPGWKAIRQRILLRDGGLCWLCGLRGADSVDHVVPRAFGGGHGDGNLRAAHTRCNAQRGARQRRRKRAPMARESRFG